MSWRTYIGEGTQDWADFNLSEYASLEALAEEIKWQMPCKLGIAVGSDAAGKALRLLSILEEDYAMPPNEFWVIWIEGQQGIEHPEWMEVRAYLEKKP